ncbi:MAG: exopolysaccharide biosynthesis polyprenyl glycosylphosphotransferase, partial [Actinobacteria bacterium]|nr:exopolysaccharide biosynthesis polyprenyl glycosylphosphotransferase [Actinomycetota bacterium]
SRNNTYLNYKIYLFLLDNISIFFAMHMALFLNGYSWRDDYGYFIPIYIITFIFYLYFGNYKYRSLKLIREFLGNNILMNIIIFGLITLIIFITPLGDKLIFINIFKFYFLIFLAFSIVVRIFVFEVIFQNLNKIGSRNRNAVILGINEGSENIFKNREDFRKNNGLNIIGFVSLRKSLIDKKERDHVLGSIEEMSDLSQKYNFKDIIVYGNKLNTDKSIGIIEELRCKNYMLHVNDDSLKELFKVGLFDIYGTDLKVIDFSIDRYYYKKYLKVLLDYIFSLIIIILILPLLLLVALFIKLSSRGPALFIGERIGINKEKFNIFKFRSMISDTKGNIEFHKEAMKGFYTGRKSGKIKKTNSDNRVTRIGRLLRRHSLDELPQFFNIIGGKMSLIGPRPCMDHELEYFKGWKSCRFKVQPGITGLWQAYGRSRVDFEGMSIFDYYYYSNSSLSVDLKVTFDTIKVLIFGIGGY